MENELVINKEYIPYFKTATADIVMRGWTTYCPNWDRTLLNRTEDILIDKCSVCRKYFPKVKRVIHDDIDNNSKCPCYIYDDDILIDFLKKVISNSEIKGD